MEQIQTHPHPEERSVSKGEAQCLQPLLRDGAIAPPQDENEAVWKRVCQAALRPLRLLCALCDYSSKVGTLRTRRHSLYRLTREGGYPGPQAPNSPAALDPGSGPGWRWGRYKRTLTL